MKKYCSSVPTGKKLTLHASIGAYTWMPNEESTPAFDVLVRHADHAMYLRKKPGNGGLMRKNDMP